MMRARFFMLLLGASLLQVSCGGDPLEPADDQLEAPEPDLLQVTTWPDAADLGVVVSSEIDPSVAVPPPPDFVH